MRQKIGTEDTDLRRSVTGGLSNAVCGCRTPGYRKRRDFGKELLTGFVAGGLSSAAFYGAGKAVETVKGSVRGAGKGGLEPDFYVEPNGKALAGIIHFN